MIEIEWVFTRNLKGTHGLAVRQRHSRIASACRDLLPVYRLVLAFHSADCAAN